MFQFDFLEWFFAFFVACFTMFLGGLLVLGAGAAFYEFTGTSCNAKSDMIGFQSKYSIATGCMVKVTENQWIPYGDLVPLERDGRIVYVPKYKYRAEIEVKK